MKIPNSGPHESYKHKLIGRIATDVWGQMQAALKRNNDTSFELTMDKLAIMCEIVQALSIDPLIKVLGIESKKIAEEALNLVQKDLDFRKKQEFRKSHGSLNNPALDISRGKIAA